MKLLIVTQVVDTEDPILGFFVRWIDEFSKHTERIEVICLKLGKSDFPKNVRAHSLGKERGAAGRATYAWRFLSLIWKLRHDYDVVFVHMNPEYVVLGGLFWRVLGKRIALWYTHKSVDLKLRFAELLADIIFTASKESFRLKSAKVRVVGHGIDTVFFSPDPQTPRGDWYISVGRLAKSKRHDIAMQKAVDDGKEIRIAGEGSERAYLEAVAKKLGVKVAFLGGLTQTALRNEYRRAKRLIHTSETGSLDKVVLEALACGLKITTRDPALKPLEIKGPQYVREHHSLRHLISVIIKILS